MARRIGIAVFLILSVIAAAVGVSEAEGPRQHGGGCQTEKREASSGAPVSTSSELCVTTPLPDVGSEKVDEKLTIESEEYRIKGRKVEEKSKEEEKDEEEEEEEGDEKEYEDEYEEELKAVAESHEAMSKDEPKTGVLPIERNHPIGEQLPGVKSFDSHEVTVANFSDEDIASNEAITDEVVDKNDKEVAELLKYKKKKNPKFYEKEAVKKKRVPTVKKELSTQKEILVASNETQLPKSLVPPDEPSNPLNQESESLRRRYTDETKTSPVWESDDEKHRSTAKTMVKRDETDNVIDSSSNRSPMIDPQSGHLYYTEMHKKLLQPGPLEYQQLQKLLTDLFGVERVLKQQEERRRRLIKNDHIPDYDVPEQDQRPRYNQQLPAASPEFPRRKQYEDYLDDYGSEPDNFAHYPDYRQPVRELGMSRSWPNGGRMYGIPIFGKWPWRQPQSDFKYWPQRGKFLPPERGYWPSLSRVGEIEDEIEAEQIWRQHQQARYPWERGRPGSWPMEKPLKIPPWHRPERPEEICDKDHSSSDWEKSKNRSEHEKTPAKSNTKGKAVLSEITMKSWNSLTSDPATWPYKLPGAKPWPKDENGKSYNPNADLVKKLGLDKEDNAWSKEVTGKPYDSSIKQKLGKQSRLLSSKKDSKQEETSLRDSQPEKKLQVEKSNLSDYDARLHPEQEMKPWPMSQRESKIGKESVRNSKLTRETPQNDEGTSWARSYDATADNSWSTSKESLPKIQSVSAWVMPADQSTWKPYQIKPIETLDENSSSPRRWSADRSSSAEHKWSEKMNDASDTWLDQAHAVGSWPEKSNSGAMWPVKTTKSNSWFTKAKDPGGWSSKPAATELWSPKVKSDSSWLSKPNGSSWSSKVRDNNSWSMKPANSATWSSRSNDSKFGNREPWSPKTKDVDSWKSESSGVASWKSSQSNPWSRKASSSNNWGSKTTGELSPWQRKMNEEWNFGKASATTGTWPSKWKQFAYHRVTAIPISKPGTTVDAAAAKPKNAFIAVSAVSSPKYTGNDWRKNEDETRNYTTRIESQERSRSGQGHVGLERPIYAWKKDSTLTRSNSTLNITDPLENQLEALRQMNLWSYRETESKRNSGSTTSTSTSTTPWPTGTTPRQDRNRKENELFETHEKPISMK